MFGGYARHLTTAVIWGSVGLLVCIPILVAALSPLNSGRGLDHITGEMAGVVALALLLLQPLLAAAYLPGRPLQEQRQWHRWVGGAIVLAVLLHIAGLYLTSPDDMTDALLLVAPTPFSVYGVIGLWSVLLTAVLVLRLVKTKFSPKAWRITHNIFAAIMVFSSITHALMIEGAMGSLTKLILCVCVGAATVIAIVHLRVVKPFLQNSKISQS